MNVTSKTIYAIVALVELAKHGNKCLKGGIIAKKYGIPRRFLEITLSELKIHNLVNSKKGSNGGFYISKRPDDISLYDIVSITEKELDFFNCNKFLSSEGCNMLRILDELNNEILSRLRGITLRDILNTIERDNGSLNFII